MLLSQRQTPLFNVARGLLLLCLFVASPILAQDEKASGYEYLNTLRLRADMVPFATNLNLETAAENHSNYLIVNSTANLRYGGHFENQGDPGFTGNQVSDRTRFTGYLSTLVGENVSTGQTDVFESIDGLMSAIYHRFGFFSFSVDEIGLGINKNPDIDYTAYTYNMGNAGLNALCNGDSFAGAGSFFLDICAQDPDFRISATDKNAAENNLVGQNPMIVNWPVQGDDDVPPAFFEESPDPLPDLEVSGYPVSLQFNPLSFNQVTIDSFQIFDDATGAEITNTRLLDENTDPNFTFSELEFALYPIERLDWKSVYRVEVEYDSNMGPGSLLWKFATRNPGAPIFEYAGDSSVVEIPENVTEFNFYIPPEEGFPTIGAFNTSMPAGLSLDTEFVDGNTLLFNMSGTVGQQADIFLNGRSFSLLIGNAAQIPPDPILDLSIGNEAEETIASFDFGTQILTIPLLVVDDGDRAGVTLKLLDSEALTFQLENVVAADETVTNAATFTTPSLLLDIPKVDVNGTQYFIQMQLIDANAVILQISAAETLN